MRGLLGRIAARPVIAGLILAVLFEAVTLVGRFGLGFRVADHREAVVRMTLGLRIHHGYPGLILIAVWLVARLLQTRSSWPGLVGAVGVALVTSDAIHHVILKLVTGCAEFP